MNNDRFHNINSEFSIPKHVQVYHFKANHPSENHDATFKVNFLYQNTLLCLIAHSHNSHDQMHKQQAYTVSAEQIQLYNFTEKQEMKGIQF